MERRVHLQSDHNPATSEQAIIPRGIAFLNRYAPPNDNSIFVDTLFLRGMLEYAFEEMFADPRLVTDEMAARAALVTAIPSAEDLPDLMKDSRFVGRLLYFALTGQPFVADATGENPGETPHLHDLPHAA